MSRISYNSSFERLKSFCEAQEFKGWDPYDGLNSKLFQGIPLLPGSRWARLAWIQFFKRSPVNLRALCLVGKEYNPKGIGLFLHGYCNLYKAEPKKEYLEVIHDLAKKVIEMQSKGYSGACWGYNFDWQARAFFQPKYTPTVVATTFVASALIEAFEVTDEKAYLDVAVTSKDFILNDLNRTYDSDGDFSFSYSPLDQSQVFNASLLGSRLLAQIFRYTNEQQLLTEARKSIAFCCKYQQQSGEWSYGTLPFHQWIDNFHTGYNLECIAVYQEIAQDYSFAANLENGLIYYLTNFFTTEGIPKYFNDKVYPVDIHATSQLIITLSRLGRWTENKMLVDRVLSWTIEHMQDKRGYFYYQLKRTGNSKIPYMRWAQAWMFFAFTVYFLQEEKTV